MAPVHVGETCSVAGRGMPGAGIEACNGESKIPERLPAPRVKASAAAPHHGWTAATEIGTAPFDMLAIAEARTSSLLIPARFQPVVFRLVFLARFVTQTCGLAEMIRKGAIFGDIA